MKLFNCKAVDDGEWFVISRNERGAAKKFKKITGRDPVQVTEIYVW